MRGAIISPRMSDPPSRSGPPVEARVAFLLSQIGRAQSTRFADRLAPLGLRPKHFALLNEIALGEGSSQQQLGQRLKLDPSGLVAALHDLEREALVERDRAPRDRRRYALRLTDAGREQLHKGRSAARETAGQLLRSLTKQEITELHRVLETVALDADSANGE